MEISILWIAALSAFFAAVAAIANLLQARGLARSNEVSVYLEFTDRYRTDAIREALRRLAKFWQENHTKGDLGETIQKIKETDPNYEEQIQGDIRSIAGYFIQISFLFEDRIISRRLTLRLIQVPGLNIFYEVIWPIRRSLTGHENTKSAYRTLKRLKERVGEGMYYR
jgi:hypothetical protein